LFISTNTDKGVTISTQYVLSFNSLQFKKHHHMKIDFRLVLLYIKVG